MIQHYFNVVLVLAGSGFLAWCWLDWIGAFPELPTPGAEGEASPHGVSPFNYEED